MRLGILVRLRPTGPWRIGPDSGARDRVETIYHSDSMYSAVTAAMARLGRLEEWLEATAANAGGSDVRFSSCYPFQRKTMFVIPPRSVWPPAASAKIRYKGARFVPLQLVATLLADQPVDETRWLLDGPSECLLPSDRNEGPFRATLRSSAAVDRLTPGACEVHTTACLEFAPGSGLWFLVGFASREARERWAGPVKTALRLLADTGFGGERSQGWGRSEAPEFVDGDLPGFVLPPRKPKPPKAAVIAAPVVSELAAPAVEEPEPSRDGNGAVPEQPTEPPASEETVVEALSEEAPVPDAEGDAAAEQPSLTEQPTEPPANEELAPSEEAVTPPLDSELAVESPPNREDDGSVLEQPAEPPANAQPTASEELAPPEEAVAPPPASELTVESPVSVEEQPAEPPAEVRGSEPRPADEPAPPTEQPVVEESAAEESSEEEAAESTDYESAVEEPIPAQQAWWMLSLFSPNAADQVDWARGKYALVVRSGRVESAARHGDLKTPANMIQEGSVLVSDTEPRGGARNVAPENFPHPVYRAGFALAIPIPLRVTP